MNPRTGHKACHPSPSRARRPASSDLCLLGFSRLPAWPSPSAPQSTDLSRPRGAFCVRRGNLSRANPASSAVGHSSEQSPCSSAWHSRPPLTFRKQIPGAPCLAPPVLTPRGTQNPSSTRWALAECFWFYVFKTGSSLSSPSPWWTNIIHFSESEPKATPPANPSCNTPASLCPCVWLPGARSCAPPRHASFTPAVGSFLFAFAFLAR